MLTTGRLVGIPKPDGGVRPIVISSIFIKMTGSCVLSLVYETHVF
jgi:hypothetical protein